MFIKKIVFLMCLSLYSFVAFAGQQSAVSHGVNVRGANNNPLTETVCAKKYYSCMDAFCMLDNKPGGRCLCNDSYSDYDSVALEIEALDKQSYLLATTGVEIIESGQDVADMMEKNTTAKVDLSLWDSVVDDGLSGSMSLSPTSELDGLVGEKLRRTVSDLCLQQIPECESELRLLPSFYSNSIKSDCLGYENALKQQKTASQQKMDSAERALRSAALAQLKIENKYDLGQCITAFKDCMINTAGCGDDFSKCTDITMAADNATNAIFSIKGNISNIDIFKSTYDRLSAKKIMCDNVLKSCSLVSDMVWDGFLAEAAPQIKKAELIAQDNIRQDCVGNISKCFQTACKDNIDPNKPDESYDMCLTRPQSVLSFCKVELNACGVDAGSSETAEKSEIWDFVLARLASMRVDSCTASVKNCLQSEGRCGKDFTQCVGLDTNTIMHMCPYDKLTECTKQYGETNIRGDDVYDELAFMVQGIMLNIDNNMLEYCQNAVDSAMIKVCGDANNCDKMAIADDVGAGSLDYNLCEFGIKDNELVPNYANCRTDMIFITDKELGRISGSKDGLLGPITPFMPIIGGTIYWESVGANESGKIPSVDEYLAMLSTTGITDTQKQRVENELLQVQNGINIAIDAVEQDPIVNGTSG